jgi:hypothetical protein
MTQLRPIAGMLMSNDGVWTDLIGLIPPLRDVAGRLSQSACENLLFKDSVYIQAPLP